MSRAAIILAAGQGTRMKSRLPKVLHPVAGKPMLEHVLAAVRGLEFEKTVLVLGHNAAAIREALDTSLSAGLLFVEQHQQLGTGHAVSQTRDLLDGQASTILVLHADHPLIRTETLSDLARRHQASRATITLLSVLSDDSMEFGRIVRDAAGAIVGIVEEADATPEQREIRELNCGMYCFEAGWLWEHLPQIQPSGRKQEYYLTDLIAMAVKEKCRIEAVHAPSVSETIGINTRVHLARAEKTMRQRINEALMLAGVTMVDPESTFVDANVDVGSDTVIEPNTHILGETRLGAGCRIGPNTLVRDSQIGDNCIILSSVVESSTLEDDVEIGPFCHLRPGAYLERNVYLGNYVEVKNSRLGEGTHAGHFCYLGDAEIGARVNVGAGTITVNYDGAKKNKTIIGDDAFIGSDTMLVAPVTIGARAKTGAGSVVTKSVPPDSLAVGVPARVIRTFARELNKQAG